MPGTSDPPRPHLSSAVRNYLVGCSWDAGQSRVEDGSGNPVSAWLNQSGAYAIDDPVRWEVGATSTAGASVQATIPNGTFTIVKNGTYNQTTGLVTYSGKSYRFVFAMSGGSPQMLSSEV